MEHVSSPTCKATERIFNVIALSSSSACRICDREENTYCEMQGSGSGPYSGRLYCTSNECTATSCEYTINAAYTSSCQSDRAASSSGQLVPAKYFYCGDLNSGSKGFNLSKTAISWLIVGSCLIIVCLLFNVGPSGRFFYRYCRFMYRPFHQLKKYGLILWDAIKALFMHLMSRSIFSVWRNLVPPPPCRDIPDDELKSVLFIFIAFIGMLLCDCSVCVCVCIPS